MEIPRRFRGVAFLMSKKALCHSRIWDRPLILEFRDIEAAPSQDLEAGVHQRLLGEVFFLRTEVRDMVAKSDLLIQRVRAFARWELMREWLEKRIDHWNPVEEYRRYMFLFEGVSRHLGGSVRAHTLRSVVGSRFSEGALP
ncbi:hypothetical protein Bca101_057709 [Brassica carinata]